MSNVRLFPGVNAVTEPEPDEIDLDAVLSRQGDLLGRWKALGEELRRRAEHPLPFDIALELRDLIDETDA